MRDAQLLFWSLIPLLFIFQLIFTLNSQTQIRYEDLAESVRNPFWLQNGLVYDGVSSNVGWYGTLLIIYKIFGFHLHAAKVFKLALYLVSMICLAALLKKYINVTNVIKLPWLPLMVVGLSPTILYYNTIQASHGIDLLYFPIVLFLVIQKRWWIQFLGWAVAMWAWMSYPTFIYYLPALIFFHPGGVLIRLAVFLTPLFITILFIKNSSLLLFDPKISSGVFRGGGHFDFSLDNISQNLGGLVTDLFVQGSSYHFEVFMGEFSLIFPILIVVLVLIISFKKRNKRSTLALGSMVAVLVLSSLTQDPSGAPGMRRYTPVLAAFYTLLVMIWHSGVFKKWGVVILSLLLVHHLIVYPINLIHLKDISPDAYPIWFNSAETPTKSLNNLLDTVQKEDLKLVCLDKDGKPFFCRVSEAYAAVAGSCTWNHLDCHQILGWDFKTGQFIPLSPKLWNDYYFEH